MDGTTFEPFVRRATAAVSRRASLLAVGATALAPALGGPSLVQAGKAGKKAKKKCKRQRGQCETFIVTEVCAVDGTTRQGAIGGEGIPNCVEVFTPCCDFFAQCQAGEGLSCLNQKVVV